jgi:hypothetical protein
MYLLKGLLNSPPLPPFPPSISLVSYSIAFFLIQLVFLHSVLQMLVTANTVPSSLILFILMMAVIHSSKMLVLTRATWRQSPDDGILHRTQLITESLQELSTASEQFCLLGTFQPALVLHSQGDCICM